jgi:CRP/FNR family transcriptional regulator, cyclic AMP receptor protein
MAEAKTKTPRDYAEFLRAGRWFHSLPAAFQEALLAAATLRALPAGTTLFSRGDEPSGIYAVLDGAIRVSGVADSGKESLLIFTEPPSWFGEIAVFDELPRTHDAVAETASLVLHLPQAELHRILAREPAWWRDLGRLVANKLRLAFLVIEETAVMTPAARLARRLVFMTEGYGEWYDRSRRVVSIRQEQLAMMLNLSRQTVNQLLKELEARGLVRLAYGEIEILDADGLRAAATAGGG